MHDPYSTKVALLAGGNSQEREVSLASGSAVRRALSKLGYEIEDFDPACRDDLAALIACDADVAYIAMHGRGGEDGVIQGFLEAIEMPFTGSGVLSSALAMDKHQTKVIYSHLGIPTPPSVLVTSASAMDTPQIISEVGERSVVKITDGGSTVGIHMVRNEGELVEALEKELPGAGSVLVERYVSGIEITISVIDDPAPRALPIIEIVPIGHEFYDYAAKYEEGGSEHIIPARIPEAAAMEAQDLAVRAHQALGCEGVSRTDMILDSDGEIWVLETNTIPGMTSTSLLPDAAAAAGISFEDLCRLFIEDALVRQRKEKI